VDRIKRLSYEVLDKHKSKFNENFTDNKKQLDNLTIIRSKGLKNEIAGYITKFIKKEHLEQQLKQSQEDKIKEQNQAVDEVEDQTRIADEIEVIEDSPESNETVIEIGVDEPESEDKPSEEKQE
jgi:small subunit ribosomal protein S17e